MRRLLVLVVVLGLVACATAAQAVQTKVKVSQKEPTAKPGVKSANGAPAPSGSQVTPTSGGARPVPFVVEVTDLNGHNDVRSVSITVYKADQATVHRAAQSAAKVSGSGNLSTWAVDFSMLYSDAPGEYWVRSTASDIDGNTDVQWANFTYAALAAIGAPQSLIPLNQTGSAVAPGHSTHDSPTRLDITNVGNVEILLRHSATALSSSNATLAASHVHLSRHANMSDEVSLGSTGAILAQFALQPGEGGTAPVYMAIHVPSGTPEGTYEGALTLEGVAR